jgi:hypothetical protein
VNCTGLVQNQASTFDRGQRGQGGIWLTGLGSCHLGGFTFLRDTIQRPLRLRSISTVTITSGFFVLNAIRQLSVTLAWEVCPIDNWLIDMLFITRDFLCSVLKDSLR